MKIGILSDSHNDAFNLRWAVDTCHAQKITTLVHCGDLTNASLVSELDGFEVIFTYGNGDFDANRIEMAMRSTHPASSCGYLYKGQLDGVAVAATHGHMSDVLDELVSSGQYRYVFTGHTHRHQDSLVKSTHVINPGALGGTFREDRTFAILDLATDDLEFVHVP